MTTTLLRVLESVHGHLGLAAAIALLHPALLLRRGARLSRAGRWSVGLTSAIVVSVLGLGLTLYQPYRTLLKRDLFAESARVGFAFETKEHLAFFVGALALGGAVAALFAAPGDVELRRAAGRTFGAAALLCIVTVAFGIAVSAVRSF